MTGDQLLCNTVSDCEPSSFLFDSFHSLLDHSGEHPAAMQHNEARSWMRLESLIVVQLLLIVLLLRQWQTC